MKFDAARVTGMIEKLGDPQYQGQDGEANIADFVAQQFTQMKMAVQRREVVGSRFPQRVAPWVGWLVYGALITASYVMVLQNHRLFRGLAILLLIVGHAWLGVVLRNGIRIGRRRPPLQTAPLVIASIPSESCPPDPALRRVPRVVFQVVLGGLQTDFFQSFRLDRRRIVMSLHCCFLIVAVGQSGIRPEGTLLIAIDSVLFALICIEILCALSWEAPAARQSHRRSRSVNASQHADRRGLSVLLELARYWPRTRSKEVEAVFVAAGGQRLDYAGAREVVRLLQLEWPSKPSLMILFFAPGAGKELLVCEDTAKPSGLKKLVEDVATSLWIPIQSTPFSAISPFWPIASTRASQSMAIIGSDLNAPSDTPVDPQALHRAIQLSSEIALRWAKNPQ
jgi:hypothetical protein